MAPISTKFFYRKKSHLVPCIPLNNQDSDGSSESEVEEHQNKSARKKKKIRSCVIPVQTLVPDSDESDCNTACDKYVREKKLDEKLVIPETSHSSNDVSGVSSTAISPISDMSSVVGSVDTSPPSPSLVNDAKSQTATKPRSRRCLFKKPTVVISDRYETMKKTSQSSNRDQSTPDTKTIHKLRYKSMKESSKSSNREQPTPDTKTSHKLRFKSMKESSQSSKREQPTLDTETKNKYVLPTNRRRYNSTFQSLKEVPSKRTKVEHSSRACKLVTAAQKLLPAAERCCNSTTVSMRKERRNCRDKENEGNICFIITFISIFQFLLKYFCCFFRSTGSINVFP